MAVTLRRSDSPTNTAQAVEIVGVSHSYGATRVLDSIDLKIRPGEFYGLLGPSGSGKTTILRAIAGFITPTSGNVKIGDDDVTGLPPNRRSSAMVFQNLALFPHLSVYANIAYGLQMRKAPKSEIRDRVISVLSLVQLEGLQDRLPGQLSGGQQQRVALARALVIEPSVVLFDEPLASLDRALRLQMHDELRRIHSRTNSTFVYVTHDQQEAMKMCDRIAVIDHGSIVQVGDPQELYERPNCRFVVEFFGEVNKVPLSRRSVDETAVVQILGSPIPLSKLGLTMESDRPMVAVVRPEHIKIGAPARACDIAVTGRISEIIYQGTHIRYSIETETSEPLIVDSYLVQGRVAVNHRVGQEIPIGWDTTDWWVFPDK